MQKCHKTGNRHSGINCCACYCIIRFCTELKQDRNDKLVLAKSATQTARRKGDAILRYFRYENTNENLNNDLKEQYKTLNNCEKRIFRKEKLRQKIIMAVSIFIYIVAVAAGFCLLNLIPQPNGLFWRLLVGAGKLIAALFILVICGVLTVELTKGLWKKAESVNVPAKKKEILSKACGHLRDYYGLQEPYIITKCFDAADKKFQNHDVCLFVVGDELRITADLIHGFLHGERDLGCYAFVKHEITLSKQLCGQQLMLEMKAGENTFLLGYRAKGFIEKNFIGKETD